MIVNDVRKEIETMKQSATEERQKAHARFRTALFNILSAQTAEEAKKIATRKLSDNKLMLFPCHATQGSLMNAIEQADALTAQAIELLLAERQRIDDRLVQLKKDPRNKARSSCEHLRSL